MPPPSTDGESKGASGPFLDKNSVKIVLKCVIKILHPCKFFIVLNYRLFSLTLDLF